MEFPEKLNLLMELFSISNSKLAKQMSIDPSLVSKWRHGNRLPARNATYIKDLVIYFYQMYQASDAMIQHRLRRLLGESAELHLDDNEMELKQLLMEWMNPSTETLPQQELTLTKSQGQQMIHMVQQLLNHESNLPMPDDKQDGEKSPISGMLRQYHLHHGRSGRRKAVLELLDQVMEMAPPQEMLLLSQEDLTWMMESRDFIMEWNKKLMAVLSMGHKITIIHHMDRQEEDLASIMKYWIPLHLTGNVKSWYFPKYVDMPMRSTYFILRDHAAIYAAVHDNTSEENNYTFYFRDPLVAKVLESSYQNFLNQCIPLVNTYVGDQMDRYMNHITELEEEAGTWIGWKNGLSSASLSVSVYEQLLVQAGIGGAERWKRLQMQQRRLEAFRKNILHFSYIEIIPLPMLNMLCREDKATLNQLESFTTKPLQLKPEHVVALLENMVDRLQKHPNYEVYLANNNPLWKDIDLSLGYKENRMALAASLGPNQERPAAILTGEGNMTQVFEGFLDTSIDSIPGNYKSRQRVIEKLLKVAKHFRLQIRSTSQRP